MALVYSEEQGLLRDAARGFLSEHSPVSALRRLRDNRDECGFSRELWQQMADMGWAGIVIPEQFGGLDFGFVGAGILCEEMGRVLCNSPFLSTALLSATLLRLAGSATQQEALLPGIAAGETIIASVLDAGVTARRSADGWQLHGEGSLVLDGHVASCFLVAARDGDDLSLFHVDAAAGGVQVERDVLPDFHNSATVRFDGVVVDMRALLGAAGSAEPVVELATDRVRCAVAAMALGVSSSCLERTIDYLRERKQFGVPIGGFQALQHRAAHWFSEIELLKSITLRALQVADEDADQLPLLAATAKAKACEVVRLSGNEAVQLHGGIGMTDEFDIGFYLKRAATLRQLFGDRYQMEDRVATLGAY